MLLEILAGILGFLFLVYRRNRRPEKYPPGPISWPIVGNLLQLGKEPYKSVMKMRNSYGDVIAIDLGTRRGVFINEYKILKETFNKSPLGRCKLQHFADPETGIYMGLGFSNGKLWAEQRKFTFSYLQSGFRNEVPWETLVAEQVSELIEDLKKSCGQPISTENAFNIPTINALWVVIAGKKYSSDDAAFIEMIQHVVKINHSTLVQGFLLFYPKFSEMFPKISGYKTFLGHIVPVQEFMKDIVEDHKKSYIEGIQRDFVDAYLQKIKSTTDSNSSFYGKTGDSLLLCTETQQWSKLMHLDIPNFYILLSNFVIWSYYLILSLGGSGIAERNLQFVLVEFFLAGTDSTASTLSWIVFLLAHHLPLQDKLISAIKLHTKQGEPISLKDRSSLPFVEAVINEALRFSSLLPMGAFHEALEDVDVGNYRLPEATVVVANQYGIMHDPEVWGDPQNFRPGRFLNEDETELVRHGALIPFGTGPRICPGESYARDQLFLFTTRIFQTFRVEFDPSCPLPPLDYQFGHFVAPVDHRILFHKLSQ